MRDVGEFGDNQSVVDVHVAADAEQGGASVGYPDLGELGAGHDDGDFDVFEGDGEEGEELEELLWVWGRFVAVDDYFGALGRHFVVRLAGLEGWETS